MLRKLFLVVALVVIAALAAGLANFSYRDSRSLAEAVMVFTVAGALLMVLFVGVFARFGIKAELGWLFQTRAFGCLVFVSILSVTIASTVPVARTLIGALRSNSWPTVQGAVTKYQVNKLDYKGSIAQIPTVAYQYEVSGLSYGGSRIGVDWFGTDWREDARILKSRIVVGEPVTIHYDPKHPATAVLLTGTTLSMWLPCLLLLPVWSGLGYCVWAFCRRRP
ncbi:MAG: DUF3592 domain-containing protein [Planctomycetaceae bacterium]